VLPVKDDLTEIFNMIERIRGHPWSSWKATQGLLCYLALFSASLQLPALAQGDAGFEQSVVECPEGDGTMGYNNIKSINNDMKAELGKILAGEPSHEPYMFSLCPSAIFDTSEEPLMPVLSGSVLYCGSKDPGKKCHFVGGEHQVLVDEPANNTDYALQTVSFVGVTFRGFSGSAIRGSAGSNTTVDLVRSNFEVR